jgi:hypothetical protein
VSAVAVPTEETGLCGRSGRYLMGLSSLEWPLYYSIDGHVNEYTVVAY